MRGILRATCKAMWHHSILLLSYIIKAREIMMWLGLSMNGHLVPHIVKVLIDNHVRLETKIKHLKN
jgi:hypothetical protein